MVHMSQGAGMENERIVSCKYYQSIKIIQIHNVYSFLQTDVTTYHICSVPNKLKI